MEQSDLPGSVAEPQERMRWHKAALVPVILVGALLRAYGLYWGFPLAWHCDENMLYGVALRLAQQITETSSLDPHFNVWGPLSVYMLLPAIYIVPAVSDLSAGLAALLAGRALAFVFDIATVLLIYALGRRAHSVVAGLLAAAFYSVTLLAVREAHFYTVDILANTVLLAYLLLCLRAVSSGTTRDFIVCGVALGVALSVKQSSLVIVPLGLIAWGAVVERRARYANVDDWRRGRRTAHRVLVALWLIAAGAFVVCTAWYAMRETVIEVGRARMTTALTPDRLAQHEPIFFERQLNSIWDGIRDLLWMVALVLGGLAGAMTGLRLVPSGVPFFAQMSKYRRHFWSFVGTAAGVFLLLNPYALIRPLEYWMPAGPQSLTWGIIQVAGRLDPPPGWALQFVGTTPYLYQLSHVLPYGMGWPLLLLSLGALALWTYRFLRGQAGPMWLVVVAALLLIVTMGGMWMKMTRYCLPLMPFFALLAGAWCAELISNGGWRRWIGGLTVVIALASGHLQSAR